MVGASRRPWSLPVHGVRSLVVNGRTRCCGLGTTVAASNWVAVPLVVERIGACRCRMW